MTLEAFINTLKAKNQNVVLLHDTDTNKIHFGQIGQTKFPAGYEVCDALSMNIGNGTTLTVVNGHRKSGSIYEEHNGFFIEL